MEQPTGGHEECVEGVDGWTWVIFRTTLIIPVPRKKKREPIRNGKRRRDKKRLLRRSDRKWEEEVQKRSAGQAEDSDPVLVRWDTVRTEG